MIDLPQDDLLLLKKILRVFAEGERVVMHGSRVKGGAWKHSDIDLCLMGEQKRDPRDVDDLRDAFSNSRIGPRVDVVEWVHLSDEFRKIIMDHHAVVQEGGVSAPAHPVREHDVHA